MTAASAKPNKTSAIIPILPPPACSPTTETAVKIGDRAVVTLHDGKEIAGAVHEFHRSEKRIALVVDGTTDPQNVAFVKIRLLEVNKRVTLVPAKQAPQEGANQSANRLTFVMEFKDGSQSQGLTLGYRSDATGLFLYPCEGQEFQYRFIPHSSIENYRFEEPPPEPPAETEADGAAAAPPPEQVLEGEEITTPQQLEYALKHHKPSTRLRIGEILVREGLIAESDLLEALAIQKQYTEQGNKRQLGQVLIELQLISQDALMGALSEKLGIPFIDLSTFKLDAEAIKYIPEELVKKYIVLPVHQYENKLAVALENPMDWEALDAVRFHCNLNVEPVIATRFELDRLIDVLYAAPDLEGTLFDDYLSGAEEEDTKEEQEYDESSVADNVIVKLVNKIIIDAYQQGASDIHIEPYPGKNKTMVRIRKDGSLKNYYEVPSKMRAALVARIKIMADLDISEKRKPQDGKIDFKKFSLLKIELRVATIPTSGDMEDVVMRILASGEPVPLEKLGLSDRNFETIKGLVSKPYGLFFVCGPTGSGKTTTLHSILGHLNTPETKIWTAEDPVEITQKGLRQVQVNNKTGFTFAAAMRAFLRADPDIIMVGEMRDKETTGTGIEASLTGHLVLATLHTNSAPESIIRLLDMGMDPFNFADALIGILAQRLTKRLCASCSEQYEASDEEIREIIAEYCFELIPKHAPEGFREELHAKTLEDWKQRFANEQGKFVLKRAVGCPTCDNTGYKGRVGIHELLAATDLIKKKILDEAKVSELTETALAEGMRTLKQDGIEKVLHGLTDLHSVRKVCIK